MQGALSTWEDVKMRVPALPPTNLGGGCNIIKVEKTTLFELEFSVDPSGMHHDLLVTLPIVVSCTNSANSGELASIEQTCTLHAHRE